MNALESERVKQLLRSALPPVNLGEGAERDLWPALRMRITSEAEHEQGRASVPVPWYDWALAMGLVVFASVAPVSIPVLLYFL